MRATANVLRILVSVIGTILIVLGLLFWSGRAEALISLHMLLGIVLVLMLWAVAVMALMARVSQILALVALIWGLIVPILGVMQVRILPTSAHWIIQVIHLLVGLTAIALANILARQIMQMSAKRQPDALPA
ncbi:MAG TPA: hypothetical protein VFU63_11210 [Ktedonobacterales bacterium]|nr:hypothetical protein [Ktedonobacterales bacterium]